LNLEKELNKLEKKYEDLTGDRIYQYHFADDKLETIRREHEVLEDLEKDQQLIDHLGDSFCNVCTWAGGTTTNKSSHLF
jgi:hypothetical protein